MRNLVIILVLFSVSCTKITEIVPEFETSTYTGYASCYDEYGKPDVNSGIRVSLSADSTNSTTTNEDGYFELKVPIGVRDFIFEKEGFGHHEHNNVRLIGGVKPVYYYTAKLYKYVNVELLDFSYSYNEEEGQLYFEAFTKSELSDYSAFVVISSKPEDGYELFMPYSHFENHHLKGIFWMVGNGLTVDDELYFSVVAGNGFTYPTTNSTFRRISDFEKFDINN